MPKGRIAPTAKPDSDKLARSACDAMTGILWNDDSQVVSVCAEKRIARIGETPGCHLHITCAIGRASKQERCAA